jgi:hypothetical protein
MHLIKKNVIVIKNYKRTDFVIFVVIKVILKYVKDVKKC